MIFLSNSRLTKLKQELSGEEPRDNTEAYKRGNLIDALITYPSTFNSFNKTVTNRYGEINYYTDIEVRDGMRKRSAFFEDTFCKQLHAASNLQEEVENECVDFGDYALACKCICDGRLKAARWPWDLKSTSASSQGAFEDVFHLWDWDRQAYFFMMTCEIDRMLFIGIENKKPHKIFRKMVIKGDDIYECGREKTQDLLIKYDILCTGGNL